MSRSTCTRSVILGALLTGVLALVLAPTFGRAASAPAWSTYQGDPQRSGDSPASGPTTLARTNIFTLPTGIQSSPAIDANGTAYVGDHDGSLYALSPSSPGGPLWSFATGGPIKGSPSLSPDGSTVYIGSADGSLYAISTSTHQKVWSAPLGSSIPGSPAVSSDGTSIYVATQGAVYSIKASDGTVNWNYNQGTAFVGSVALSLDSSTVYAAAADGLLYGIPAGGPSGLGGITAFYLDGPPTSSPSVDSNGNIYVSTVRGNLFSFSPSNTTARWTYSIFNHQISNSSMAFFQGNGFIGAATGSVYAISLQSGSQVWQYQTGGPIQASAAVTTGNGEIFIGSTDGYFYELDSTGRFLNKLYSGNSIDASPGVGPDGSVWIASESGTVYRLHDIAPPPTLPAKATATITPLVTNTPSPPTATPTGLPTNTPTITPTSALVALDFSLKAKVKDGEKQTISITSTPNATVKIRVDYPNGDHQSASRRTDGTGKATYTFTQGASKTTHSHFDATVTVKAGSGSAQNVLTKTYAIAFGKLDVSAEPRKLGVGKTVDIFVHASPGTSVLAVMLAPSGKQITKNGKTGPKGFASIKYKIVKGLTTSGNKKVIVLAKFASGRSSVSTKTTFSIG